MNQLQIKDINIDTKAGTKTIVSGVSLSIKQGEIVILMGQNGSGKSTLLNGIMGHPGYKILSGDIILSGKDIAMFSSDEKARSGLFLSPQTPPTIEGVTLAQFLYAAHRAIGGTKDILSFYKYAEEQRKKLGIEKDFLKRYVNDGLSGGEKKISELLQLAILKPKYALLDEIDSGVDMDALGKIISTIRNLAEDGIGFLLVTHSDKILDMLSPEMIYIMYDGKIARSGGKELLNEIKEKGYTKLTCQNK